MTEVTEEKPLNTKKSRVRFEDNHLSDSGDYVAPSKPRGVRLWEKGRIICVLLYHPFSLGMAIVFGAFFGVVVRVIYPDVHTQLNDETRALLEIPGSIYIRMLKIITLPMVIFRVISTCSVFSASMPTMLALRIVLCSLSTSFLAAAEGVALAVIFQPGRKLPRNLKVEEVHFDYRLPDHFLDILRAMFPSNYVRACFSKSVTVIEFTNASRLLTHNNGTLSEEFYMREDFHLEETVGMNLLGVLIFCAAFGCIMARSGEDCYSLQKFISTCSAVIRRMIWIMLWYSPIGLFFLMATTAISIEQPGLIITVKMLVVCVISGLAVHCLVVLPTALYLFSGKNPIKLMYKSSKPLMVATATASSQYTLPLTMHSLEKDVGIPSGLGDILLPFLTTLNLNGSALYLGVSCIFFSQYENVTWSMKDVALATFIASVLPIGTSAVPGGNRISLALALNACGLSASHATILLGVDWFIERLYTFANIWGDIVGTAIIHKTVEMEMDFQY